MVAELAEAREKATVLHEEHVLARTAASDVEAEITKAEQDVQQVRDRATRNRARLDSGQGTAKELQALERELQALDRRQRELEDAELEVMERAEGLRARAAKTEEASTTAASRVTELEQRYAAIEQEVTTEREDVERRRAEVVPGIGEDLLALYDRVREKSAGLAAAPLAQGRCGGCNLALTPAELSRVRSASDDEVLRCEECGRIMVRTAESEA